MSAPFAVMAAIFNLNHPAHVVHWHFIQISVANIVVIVIMFVVFAIALLARFPSHDVGVRAKHTEGSD